jgi:hypothetical protein
VPQAVLVVTEQGCSGGEHKTHHTAAPGNAKVKALALLFKVSDKITRCPPSDLGVSRIANI